MGGTPPLKDQRLLVDQNRPRSYATSSAATLCSDRWPNLCRELEVQGYRTKAFTSVAGRSYGRKAFTRGHLYHILQNRIHPGEVAYKDDVHRGEHTGIVERVLWDKVHQVMGSNRRSAAMGMRCESNSLFKGLVFDDAGNRMSPADANKAGRRYRYYVSQALLQQRKQDAGSLPRLPAHDFETLISGRIVEDLGADARMKAALVKLGWNNDHDRQRLLRIIIKRIEVAQGMVRVQIDPAAALAEEDVGLHPEPQTLEIACNLLRDGSGVKIAISKQSGNLSRRLVRH